MLEIETFNNTAQEANWPTRCDASLDLEASSLREALGTWREVKGERRWPRRTEMTPRLMKAYLPDIGIVDVQWAPKLRFRTRVVGTNLARTFGDTTGRFLDEAVPQPYLDRWQSILKLPLDIGGPVRATSTAEFRGQDYLEVEAFYAPLGDTAGRPDAILIVTHIGERKTLAHQPLIAARHPST